ncbi:hypothetical protein LQW54_000822 [Pestalotiopsis sp. IQ-011]
MQVSIQDLIDNVQNQQARYETEAAKIKVGELCSQPYLSCLVSAESIAQVDAYAKALELLARAIRDLRQNTLQQFWVALLYSGESEDPIKPLSDAEALLEKYVQACERQQRQLDNDQSRKLLRSLGTPLRRMNVNMGALLEEMQLEKRRSMLDDLGSIKFGDQHNSRNSSRAEGTGQWLFKRQEFKLWENLGCSSIFWLTGQMGAGKSVLTSRVVDRYYIEDFQTCEPIVEGFAYFYYRKWYKFSEAC